MSVEKIFVTKSFTPPEEEYQKYVHRIFESSQFTNNGPLLKELEKQLKEYLCVEHLQFVTNGTAALQLALRGLGITQGDIITTPFSYVATTSAILWERCNPVFVDIDSNSLCLDPNKVEAAITPQTRAIMPVHVFGYPCDVEAIADIGKRHSIPVIYDAAHAFGCRYKGRSLLDYGDIATCSFHATKLFHTVEGGAVICHDDNINRIIDLAKRFGHHGDEHFQLGINAKASEFQAAMGLTNLPYLDKIIQNRKKAVNQYNALLDNTVWHPETPADLDYNYAYYPVIFKSEEELLKAQAKLEEDNIYLRRYFYPSLNTLPYLPTRQSCPISEDICPRIACLPLFYGIENSIIKRIVNSLLKIVGV